MLARRSSLLSLIYIASELLNFFALPYMTCFYKLTIDCVRSVYGAVLSLSVQTVLCALHAVDYATSAALLFWCLSYQLILTFTYMLMVVGCIVLGLTHKLEKTTETANRIHQIKLKQMKQENSDDEIEELEESGYMSDDVFLPSDGHETTNTDDSQNNVTKANDDVVDNNDVNNANDDVTPLFDVKEGNSVEDDIIAKGNHAICVARNATGINGIDTSVYMDAWTLVLNRKQIRAKKLQLQQKDALGVYEGVVRRVTRLSTSA